MYAIQSLRGMDLISYKQSLVITLIFGLAPTYLLYNQLYASDIIFSYILIPLTIQLIKLINSKGSILENNKYKISLVALLFLTYQLRKNAVLIPLGIFLIVIIRYKAQRKHCIQCIGAFLIASLLATVFWTNIVKAEPSPSQEILSVPAQQIGRVFARSGDIPEEPYNYFTSIRTEKEWKESYIPYIADPEKDSLSLTPDFIANWITLGIHNPRAYISAYVDLMNPFWQLTSTPEALGINIDFSKHDSFTTSTCNNECSTSYTTQITNSYSLPQTLASQFQDRLLQSHIPLVTDALTLLFFNRAIPLWTFTIGLVITIKKKKLVDYSIIAMPLLCILISLLCFAPVASFRYAFQAFGLLPILTTYILKTKSKTVA